MYRTVVTAVANLSRFQGPSGTSSSFPGSGSLMGSEGDVVTIYYQVSYVQYLGVPQYVEWREKDSEE